MSEPLIVVIIGWATINKIKLFKTVSESIFYPLEITLSQEIRTREN